MRYPVLSGGPENPPQQQQPPPPPTTTRLAELINNGKHEGCYSCKVAYI